MRTSAKLIISLVSPFIAGALGSLATAPAITNWYTTLHTPPLNPPSVVFGPVWSVLYVLMGIALYRVWSRQTTRSTEAKQRNAVTLFFIHLGVNAAWSLSFFGLKNPFLALIVILLLLCLIIILMKQFAQFDRLSSYLLVPYLLWVVFATYLTIGFLYLN